MDDKAKILIVDDEASMQTALEALLYRENYELVFAQNGQEALKKVAEFVPDLILLDVMMPDMDGFEVCMRLRADPMMSQVPIVMVTALDDRASRMRGFEVGVDDFISKPYDSSELRARVRTITQLDRFRRLLQERARFEWVVEQADDGYLMLDTADQITYANPNARLFLSLQNHDIGSMPVNFLDIVRKSYNLVPQSAWANWPDLNSDTPKYLLRPASSTSTEFWLQVNMLAMSPTSRLASLRDVTANVISQRSTWTFHAQVAHKLRTPLGAVTGFLNFVDDPTLPEDVRKSSLESVRRSADRLQTEIENILNYMVNLDAQGSGRSSIEEILQGISQVTANLNYASLRVTHDGIDNAQALNVPLDLKKIELIIMELVGNAIKFHPEGTPNIEIALNAISEYVTLSVRDDGLLLAPNQLAKLWTPYYQAERLHTGQVPGTGLGLSGIASQVWSVGGTCRAYNRTDGPGLVIELGLPCVVDETGFGAQENNVG